MSVYLKAPHEREEELKRLYQACFEEKDEAVRILFEEYALTDTCYAVLCGGEIAAALYLLPAQAAENGRAVQAHYLFAAGTLPKYRGRGLMNGLIGYALADAAARGDRYSALLPAGRGLYQFYARFGYRPVYRAKCTAATQQRLLCLPQAPCKVINCSFDKLADLRFNILLEQNGSLLWDRRHLALAQKLSAQYGGGLFTTDRGAVYYMREGQNVYAYEMICTGADLGALLKTFARQVPAKLYRLKLPAFIGGGGNVIRYGMVKPLYTDALQPAGMRRPYLGLALD